MRELQFSAMVNQFQPGIFTALNEKKEEMIQAGKRVFNLSVGTPDFAPAPHVMEALTEACKDPENYKYALADLPELLEAVQYRYAHRFGVEYFCQLIHRDIFHVVIVNIVYSFCRTSFWDAFYGFKIQTQHI